MTRMLSNDELDSIETQLRSLCVERGLDPKKERGFEVIETARYWRRVAEIRHDLYQAEYLRRSIAETEVRMLRREADAVAAQRHEHARSCPTRVTAREDPKFEMWADDQRPDVDFVWWVGDKEPENAAVGDRWRQGEVVWERTASGWTMPS